VILKSLRNIPVNTKEDCIALLNDFSIHKKILCFLPSNDKSDINIEIGNEILNLLVKVSEALFYNNINEEECIQFRSKLEECDCFNTLLFLLNTYENISFKVRIFIILSNFYEYIDFLNEGKIIPDILIDYLKEQSTKKSNENKNNELMISVLNALINITVGSYGNTKVLFDSGIIPLLLPLVISSDTNVWKKTVLLLSNICLIESVEDKNSIINCGIFDVFHKKLLEISPPPP
jgi:isocitrate dehydrogenase kinase/phosphatase